MEKQSFDKSVTDLLECNSTHPVWTLPGNVRVDLRKPQEKPILLRLAQFNPHFTVKTPKTEEKPEVPKKGKTSESSKA